MATGLAEQSAPAAKSGTPVIASSSKPSSPQETFSTGVAKGRDRLDSATSTSSMRGDAIEQSGAHTLAEALRSMPGLRVDPAQGEGAGNYTIRGLPLASSGSKFMQLQEDGLPALEFADIFQAGADMFLRYDLSVGQIETLRGGSASTFASNSPGGVINLISKTGDTQGGAIQLTEGINFGQHRLDFDYGAKLTDTLRYHIGGFYRKGEGVRRVGFDAYNGGQVKFNLTKQFNAGYVRLYLKLLDDQTPGYLRQPIAVSGTDANPVYSVLPNYDARRDAPLSRYITTMTTNDENNKAARYSAQNGQRIVSKSIGLETQFDVAGWTITDKFRYAANSGHILFAAPFVSLPGAVAALAFGGPGATFSYASGPNTGQAIANPAMLNGNGIVNLYGFVSNKLNNLDNMTNDFRVSRVLDVSGGDLTLTGGVYKSIQKMDIDFTTESTLADVSGGGNSALLNLNLASGVSRTQNGTLYFGTPDHSSRRNFDIKYDITAPYASVNYHIGKLAIGGSLRYDSGSVRGVLYGGGLGDGRPLFATYDMNGDGTISIPETMVDSLPLNQPGKVDYRYHYLSYSGGINYRIAHSLSVFGRYSRGARAGADRILFGGLFNNTTGQPLDPSYAYNPVRQTEFGMKYREGNVTLNVTGFYAKANDLNTQIVPTSATTIANQRIIRVYTAKGVELEAGLRFGPFSLNAGATYTKAKISSDMFNPAVIGNIPRNQPNLIFNLSPLYNQGKLTVGANIFSTTGSFAQDGNQLRMPGYTVVNSFVAFRPINRLELALKVNNLFDQLAITGVQASSLPAVGVTLANVLPGRTISTSARLTF